MHEDWYFLALHYVQPLCVNVESLLTNIHLPLSKERLLDQFGSMMKLQQVGVIIFMNWIYTGSDNHNINKVEMTIGLAHLKSCSSVDLVQALTFTAPNLSHTEECVWTSTEEALQFQRVRMNQNMIKTIFQELQQVHHSLYWCFNTSVVGEQTLTNVLTYCICQ